MNANESHVYAEASASLSPTVRGFAAGQRWSDEHGGNVGLSEDDWESLVTAIVTAAVTPPTRYVVVRDTPEDPIPVRLWGGARYPSAEAAQFWLNDQWPDRSDLRVCLEADVLEVAK